MNKIKPAIVLLIIIALSIIFSAKGCFRKNTGNKTGSSDIAWPGINAPSNLTATAVSYSQINLSWTNNASNNDGFEIERSLNGTNYLLLTTLYFNVTTYSDIGIIPFSICYYKVRAFNTNGDYSSYSNIADASLQPSAWLTIAVGESHSLALASDGTLWGWGDNQYGQLDSSNDALSFTVPALLSSDIDWLKTGSGYNHTLAIKTLGTLWSWGNNDVGQLGLGNTDFYTEPRPVGTYSDWFIATAGNSHTIALKTSGTLWSWGWNTLGQLGLGYTTVSTAGLTAPIQVGIASDWSIIISGASHNFAIKTNQTLWAWGWNFEGCLGDGTDIERWTPRQIGADSDWAMVTANYNQSFALKNTPQGGRTLWGWGYNYSSGGSNIPSLIVADTDWLTVSAGGADVDYGFTLVKKTGTEGGILWSWGGEIDSNYYGQLGLGDNNFRPLPVQIPYPSDSWSIMAAGGYHSLGLTTNGKLWVWGYNYYGQLGLGDTINRNTPVLIGE